MRCLTSLILVFAFAASYSFASAAENDFEIRPGFVVIDNIDELRHAMARSDQNVRMRPGVYRVTDAAPDNRTVFVVSGDNNHFDLRGVTIEIDTQVLADLRGPVHSLTVYRVTGDRIIFEGAKFEDVGDSPPYQSLSEFNVTGDDVRFMDCRFIIRGSAPYGVGDLYGKGAGAAVRLQKHAAICIVGDRCLIEDCDFRIHTFGHGIHMHGAQDTVVRRITMEGDLRPTDDIYGKKDGIAARFDYKMKYPPWDAGRPIPHGQMLSLTEDGIRAYVYGNDKEGNQRRTGHVTVEDCTIRRMRGGIALGMAWGGKITGTTVLDCGGYAYSIPQNGVVRNCEGNAAYAPLLNTPYNQIRKMDVELTLVESDAQLGDHPLIRVVGSGHRIVISAEENYSTGKLRPILLGQSSRYNERNLPPDELRKKLDAREISLINRTPHPVVLYPTATRCKITTDAPVEDRGSENEVNSPGSQ